MSELEVFSDLSERIAYNIPDFPLYARKGDLKSFSKFRAACHWHLDLEFIYMLEGQMDYFINGQTLTIREDNGIFVNSKRLHYGYSPLQKDCKYLVIAIHPSLFNQGLSFIKQYWEEKFGMLNDDYLLLDQSETWHDLVIRQLISLYDKMHSSSPEPFELLQSTAVICQQIGAHIHTTTISGSLQQDWLAIIKMTGFIHENYDAKITLEQIASSGAVCRSRCCSLFLTHTSLSPIAYLNNYRLQKSCEMLKNTKRTISEIGLACGFQNPSYFSASFKKEYGVLPKEYRKS